MGLYFLYMLLFILAPLGYGVALAVLLKEIHGRQAGEIVEKTESVPPEKEAVEPDVTADEPVTDEPVAKGVEPSSEESVQPEDATPETSPEIERQNVSSETDSEETESQEPPLHSVFDDQGLLPKSFKADEVIDEILNEDRAETPDDLSSRIEEDSDDFETQSESFEQDQDNDFFDLEDDILVRAMEFAESGKENKIDFSGEESLTPDAISPTARELLGEDFDFDSLTAPIFDPNDAVKATEEAPLRELGGGAYQAETPMMTDDLSLLDAMPEEQDIISAFPREMVQNVMIEPDHSEAARQHSFVEELRPMLVRQRSKRKEE